MRFPAAASFSTELASALCWVLEVSKLRSVLLQELEVTQLFPAPSAFHQCLKW